MMKVKYYLMNPTNNITVLAEASVPAELQPAVASELMKLEPTAEQVGFVSGNTLRMAGGEFCGNASMSAAVLKCIRDGIKTGESRTVYLDASGTDNAVKAEITANADSFSGTVSMPAPLSICDINLDSDGEKYTLPCVDFGGIVHLIAENAAIDKASAEKAAVKWCEELNADALGIMLYDSTESSLEPLVYARNAGTLFWESSCASGTSAVGAYLAKKEKRPVCVTLKEPGGSLTVSADGSRITISGTVRLIKTDTVEINI